MFINRVRKKAVRVRNRAKVQEFADAASSRLLEELSYSSTTKLLIVHADDLGLTHSVNTAFIKAIDGGQVTSGSVMVPCRGFSEIASYALEHPHLDLGVHLTLNSEWKHYRWGPVLAREEVASLVDKSGYFYQSRKELARKADPHEVVRELRTQVQKAKVSGINPTHLDTHMLSLFETKDLFEAYLQVAREFRIPAMVPLEHLVMHAPNLISSLRPEDQVIDRMVMANTFLPEAEWEAFYLQTVESLEPGVTQILVHMAYADKEMRSLTADHPTWGAARWQRDLSFFTSSEVEHLLDKHKVRLITWRDIGNLL